MGTSVHLGCHRRARLQDTPILNNRIMGTSVHLGCHRRGRLYRSTEYSIVQNRSILNVNFKTQERPKINFRNFGTLVLRSIVRRQTEMILSKSYAKPPFGCPSSVAYPQTAVSTFGDWGATLQSRPRLVTNPRRYAPVVFPPIAYGLQ